jgi:hypothetical protein
VHRGDFFASPARPFERHLCDPPTLLRGHLAHGDRDVGRRHELAAAHEHVAVGVEAFGTFTEDDEVDGLSGKADAHARLCGADVREEIELRAELARRIDPALLARRVLKVIDGPEDDARRLARGFHHVFR